MCQTETFLILFLIFSSNLLRFSFYSKPFELISVNLFINY